MHAHGGGAKPAEVEVEVGVHRHKLADLDRVVAFAQPFERLETGRVVVARDIEPVQRRGQIKGGEVIGGEGGDHGQCAAAPI